LTLLFATVNEGAPDLPQVVAGNVLARIVDCLDSGGLLRSWWTHYGTRPKTKEGRRRTQLGDLKAAKAHLARATTLDKKFSSRAVDDPDLEPLWNSLSSQLS
jgi:hypothetical protein